MGDLAFVAGGRDCVLGLGQAIKAQDNHKLLVTVVLIGVSLRMIGLFTCPILEIDYYRYLWDGKVLAQGVSPYQYSPGQILKHGQEFDQSVKDISDRDLSDSSGLGKLIDLSVASESNNTIVKRIHFNEYSSIYPPISQLVFGASMKWFPASASVAAHIFCIKAVLVVFDLMILGVILYGLHPCGSFFAEAIPLAQTKCVLRFKGMNVINAES